MKSTLLFRCSIALALATWAVAVGAAPSPNDALLNKLVDKGILTATEAKELQVAAQADFNTASRARTGMPDWVERIKFSGDFRGRFDGIYAEDPLTVDRNRLRYRLRVGLTAQLLDDFEVGLRLQSGEPVGEFGGNPISGNATLQDNGAKKLIGISQACVKWTPLHTEKWHGGVTFGKMDLPLEFPSSLVFGKDYQPEGLAAQIAWQIAPRHTLKLNAAAFVLDELAASSADPWLGALQCRWDSAWTPHLATSFGVTVLSILHPEQLVNTAIPNVNRGNTRTAAGAPAYGFDPIHTDLSVTYSLNHIPGYPGKFPITCSGEFIHNPDAPAKNDAWSAGLAFGKSGHHDQWALSYRWVEVQADAWFEEVMESDFGAYYRQQQANAGFSSVSNPSGGGFSGGTNIRGHLLRAEYSPYDSLTLSCSWALTSLIEASPAGAPNNDQRVQVDAQWKF